MQLLRRGKCSHPIGGEARQRSEFAPITEGEYHYLLGIIVNQYNVEAIDLLNGIPQAYYWVVGSGDRGRADGV
jgi:hypothetical protein